jgi:hypothetical protein
LIDSALASASEAFGEAEAFLNEIRNKVMFWKGFGYFA